LLLPPSLPPPPLLPLLPPPLPPLPPLPPPPLLLLLLMLLMLLPHVHSRPARKQMSDDHLVHSEHNGNDELKPSRSSSRRPGYWITGRYSVRVRVCPIWLPSLL